VEPAGLPEGRYPVLRHTGPYDGLLAGNAALLQWAQEKGIKFDTWDTPQGSAWRGRLSTTSPTRPRSPTRPSLRPDIAVLIREA
jgi:hypothetical protein